jgi:hypothetical protein
MLWRRSVGEPCGAVRVCAGRHSMVAGRCGAGSDPTRQGRHIQGGRQ